MFRDEIPPYEVRNTPQWKRKRVRMFKLMKYLYDEKEKTLFDKT